MKAKYAPLDRREGFWHDQKGSLLPKPVPNEKPWKGKKLFIRKLIRIEDQFASKKPYKGWSSCRLCSKERNGYSDYSYKGWTWPEGYVHYINKHNIRPSLAFQEFILGKYIGDDE